MDGSPATPLAILLTFDAPSVTFGGSGAIDNLVFAPLATEGYLFIGPSLGRSTWRGDAPEAAWSIDLAEVTQVIPFEMGSAPSIPCPMALFYRGASHFGTPSLYAQVVTFHPTQGGALLRSNPVAPIGRRQLAFGQSLSFHSSIIR